MEPSVQPIELLRHTHSGLVDMPLVPAPRFLPSNCCNHCSHWHVMLISQCTEVHFSHAMAYLPTVIATHSTALVLRC